MRIVGIVKKLLDPVGPIGQWLSPSEVFKERVGLPIDAPRAIYGQAPQTTADVERAIQPERVLPADADVPKSRVRAVSAYIEEHYAPIYAKVDSTDYQTILMSQPELVGWRVTAHVRKEARAKAPLTAEQFKEHVQSLQMQPSDEFYNVYMETIPGNDPVIVDGEILRAQDGTIITGGTQIRGGRKEYNERTKDMIHWDKTFYAEREKALAELSTRPVRNVQRALEATAGAKLPMYRAVGVNPRRDRSRS